MKFWEGYKSVVAETFTIQTQIFGCRVLYRPASEVSTIFAVLEENGKLTVYVGYPWNKNDGPVFDNKKSIEASCVHDVLCDMINLGLLSSHLQPLADREYYKIATEKGMWEWAVRLRLVVITWYMTGKAKRYERRIYEA